MSVAESLIESVRAKAAERPDFVYEPVESGDAPLQSCVYVKDGAPSCLVGHALWDLGLIGAGLEHTSYNNEGIDDLLTYLNIEASAEVRDWLSNVQEQQDIGEPWGDAVVYADDTEDAW